MILEWLDGAAVGTKRDEGEPLPAGPPPQLLARSREFSEGLAVALESLWLYGGQVAFAELSIDDDETWSVTTPGIEKAIDRAALALAQSTLRTTDLAVEAALAATREAIKQGLVEDGDPVRELARKINAIFKDLSGPRAKLIAQTEASRAHHAAYRRASEDSGVVVGWQWLASSNACPRCSAMSGRKIQASEAFVTGLPSKEAAYRTCEVPGLHPGCRCSFLAVLHRDYGGPSSVEWDGPVSSDDLDQLAEPPSA